MHDASNESPDLLNQVELSNSLDQTTDLLNCQLCYCYRFVVRPRLGPRRLPVQPVHDAVRQALALDDGAPIIIIIIIIVIIISLPTFIIIMIVSIIMCMFTIPCSL